MSFNTERMTREEKYIHEIHAKLVAVGKQRDAALDILRQIISDLPSNRDWLDPELEKLARAAIAKATGGEV